MKKRNHRRKVVYRTKKNDQLWGIIWFAVLLLLALATLVASRQSYLLGQTLGTCTDPYSTCPTSTTAPQATATPKSSTNTNTTTTTIAPTVTLSQSPSVSPSQNTTPLLSPPTTISSSAPNPSDTSDLIQNPDGSNFEAENESGGTPAIRPPRSLRSLISDPGTGEVTTQSLISAPAAFAGAMYDVAYDTVLSQINSFTNSVSHVDSPLVNRFRLPAQVCTFLGNVGMEWLCE